MRKRMQDLKADVEIILGSEDIRLLRSTIRNLLWSLEIKDAIIDSMLLKSDEIKSDYMHEGE